MVRSHMVRGILSEVFWKTTSEIVVGDKAEAQGVGIKNLETVNLRSAARRIHCWYCWEISRQV